MLHNMLIDPLPKTVEVGDKEYSINYGYRALILIEIAMFSDMEDSKKLFHALDIFYRGNIPPEKNEAMEKLLWFYRCGELVKKENKSKVQAPKKQRKRAYCFETDAGRIYAAFRSQYGINLQETPSDKLHWWEFMAMFDSLAEELLISRVMYYRTADLTGMGKNQKAFIKRMRKIYEIKHATSDLDDRAKLARRNNDMKEYVRRRMEECRRKPQESSAGNADT